MCGIVGCLPAVERNILVEALKNIAHRGPDGEGIWYSEDRKISLGHRRLSIIDTSETGQQPMMYLDRFVITFNGEIYNFIEIKKELEKLGHKFRTQSDTEVVLAAFCEWKEDCLLKFNGMWAFAIWDDTEKTLFLSRDRFGIKPLYYSLKGPEFVFGSEMKALAPFLKRIEISENFQWCVDNIFDYESTEKCLIRGIKRFPAGHFAYFKTDNKKLNLTRYWDTAENLEKTPKKYEDQVEYFKELFFDAVKLRMRSDVRVGTTLSGGLDSSAVISTIANVNKDSERVSRDWQHAFVACFKGTFLDERVYAQKVVDHINIPATFVEIVPPDFDEVEKMLFKFEDIYLTSPVPMMRIYNELRKNDVSVSIDGHGADELFCGYGYEMRHAILDAGLNWKSVKSAHEAYIERYPLNSDMRFNYSPKKYYEEVKSLTGGKKGFLKFFLSGGKSHKMQTFNGSVLNYALYALFHRTVLPTLLRNYDRYSMASGVEVRMPFMDYRVVKFLFSLPWDSKIRDGFTKALLRDAIGPFMPEEITWRRSKIGFNTPIDDWIKEGWQDSLKEIVNSREFNNSAFVEDPEGIRDLFVAVSGNEKGSYAKGEMFWQKISPFLWERSVLRHL